MLENLKLYGYPDEDIPIVVQYNKRDLAGILPVEELEWKINSQGFPSFTSVAISGEGVFTTLKESVKRVVRNLRNK
jgi:hypothetical protein